MDENLQARTAADVDHALAADASAETSTGRPHGESGGHTLDRAELAHRVREMLDGPSFW